MKTIEILSNGKHVQFTTKSVTIEGQEYLYSHITELRHSEAKHVYGFKCDGDVIMLPYEDKDEQVLKVIFSQVRQMHRKAAAPKEVLPKAGEGPDVLAPAEAPAAERPVAAVPEAEAPVAEEAVAQAPSAAAPEAETSAAEEPATEDRTEEDASTEVPAAKEAAATTDTPDAANTAEAEPAPAEVAPQAPALTAKERKQLEKAQRKADKEAAKREKQAGGNGGSVTYAESETVPQDPAQKSARFRKAIIIFVIILAVFALLAVAYYFLIGPASDPQIGPNTTDTPQYNDIDDMINDLEN